MPTKAKWYQYTVYGLVVCTNNKLPGFLAASQGSTPDVFLHLGNNPPDFAQFSQVFEIELTAETYFQGSFQIRIPASLPANYCFRIQYWAGFEFVVNADGTEIWVQWPEDSDFDMVVACFAGPILGFILRLRNIICLHASVVEIDQHAIALLAPSGGGKSTTAAEMALKGYPVLSDDILVIIPASNLYYAQSGYPGMRLCLDSVSNLFDEHTIPVRLTPNGDKRYLELPQSGCRFSDIPRPLVAIYTRGSDEKPSRPKFKTASHVSALKTLLFHTYPGRYYKLPSSIRATEFKQIGQLSKQVPLREIAYQKKLEQLSDLCDALVADARMVIQESMQIDTGLQDRIAT